MALSSEHDSFTVGAAVFSLPLVIKSDKPTRVARACFSLLQFCLLSLQACISFRVKMVVCTAAYFVAGLKNLIAGLAFNHRMYNNNAIFA